MSVGLLPNGWGKYPLGSCLEKLQSRKLVERGWSPQCLSEPTKSDEEWGVLKTTAVQMGEYKPEYNKALPSTLQPKRGREVMAGDLLLTTTGPRSRCGVVCLVRTTPRNLIFSGKILRFRANTKCISASWLEKCLMSPEVQATLDAMKVGTSDSSVSIGNQQVIDLEIPVPPIREQERIDAILSQQLSRLDAAEQSVQAIREKAAQYRRSLLRAAFSGELTDEHISLFGTTAYSGHWEPRQIKEVATFAPRIPEEALAEPKDVSFLPMAAVGEVSGHCDLSLTIALEEGRRRNLTYFEDGDIIFAKITPCMENGKIARVGNLIGGRGFGSTEFHVLRPKSNVVGEYLRLFLVQDDFRSNAKRAMTGAVGQQRVPKKYLEEHEIPVPSVEQQQRIVERLQHQLSRLDMTLRVVDEVERKANALRRSLLHAAFSGELTRSWRESNV